MYYRQAETAARIPQGLSLAAAAAAGGMRGLLGASASLYEASGLPAKWGAPVSCLKAHAASDVLLNVEAALGLCTSYRGLQSLGICQ